VENQKLKLLIIDDNARFRSLIKTIITAPGDDVLELDDGRDVVSSYAAFQPDWVLMDVNMKVVNGLQATRQLIHNFPEAKVIFLSNFTSKRIIAKGLQVGARAYLSKEDLFAVQNFIRPSTAGGYHAATTR
jgi:CheY-like chemotaxis protein